MWQPPGHGHAKPEFYWLAGTHDASGTALEPIDLEGRGQKSQVRSSKLGSVEGGRTAY